jgi:hypothetical protein
MPPESEKRTEAASSAPEARGAVFQPVIDGWAVTRPSSKRLVTSKKLVLLRT